MRPAKFNQHYGRACLNVEGAFAAFNLCRGGEDGAHSEHLQRPPAQCDFPLPLASQFRTVAKAMC